MFHFPPRLLSLWWFGSLHQTLACLVCLLSPASAFALEETPVFQRLAPLRATEGSALPYAAEHFWRIYGASSRHLGGLQPIRPVFGLPSFARPTASFVVEYLVEARAFPQPSKPDGSLLLRQIRLSLIPKGAKATALVPLPPPSLLSLSPLPKAVFHLRLKVALPARLAPGFYDLLHTRELSLSQASLLGLSPPSKPAGVAATSGSATSKPTAAAGEALHLSSRIIGALSVQTAEPTGSRAFRFLHLTDFHMRDGVEARMERVIAHVEQLQPRPDFAVLTGDIVEYGNQKYLWRSVIRILQKLSLPLFVIIGNHDYYRFHFGQPSSIPGLLREEEGLQEFFAHFHPFLSFRFSYGGYKWMALDTGPSATERTWTRFQWITVEGLSQAQIRDVQAFLKTPAKEGHVLLAHAGPRSSLLHTADGCVPGSQGVFLLRRKELEASLLASFRERKRPILYFHGHQHWNDIFIRTDERLRCGFLRLRVKEPMMGDLPCYRELPTLLSPLFVGTQSATKHQHLRSGGVHELGLSFGTGAGAAYGYRLLEAEGSRWKSASFRFYHKTTILARRYEDGYIHPRAFDLATFPRCSP